MKHQSIFIFRLSREFIYMDVQYIMQGTIANTVETTEPFNGAMIPPDTFPALRLPS